MLTAVASHVKLEKERSQPKPELAIVLYGRGQSVSEYATIHNVSNNRLGLGRLTDIRNVRSTITKRANKVSKAAEQESVKSLQMIPSNVLINHSKLVVWHTPAKRQSMWFSKSGEKAFNVKWPSLVWAVSSKGLYVFAKATDARPNEATRLYHAPLMNINTSGFLCQGGAQLPDERSLDTLSQIESTLTDSYFTHLNVNFNNDKRQHYSDDKNHMAFWREKEKSGSSVRAKEMKFAMPMAQFIETLTRGF